MNDLLRKVLVFLAVVMLVTTPMSPLVQFSPVNISPIGTAEAVTELWRHTGQPGAVRPVAYDSDDDEVIVGHNGGEIHAFYSNNGTEKWTDSGYNNIQAMEWDPSTDNIIVTSEAGDTIFSIDSDTRSINWQDTLPANPRRYSLSVDGTNGDIYVGMGGSTNNLRKFDSSGNIDWTVTVEDSTSFGVTGVGVDPSANQVYAGQTDSTDADLHALSTSDGSQVWEANTMTDGGTGWGVEELDAGGGFVIAVGTDDEIEVYQDDGSRVGGRAGDSVTSSAGRDVKISADSDIGYISHSASDGEANLEAFYLSNATQKWTLDTYDEAGSSNDFVNGIGLQESASQNEIYIAQLHDDAVEALGADESSGVTVSSVVFEDFEDDDLSTDPDWGGTGDFVSDPTDAAVGSVSVNNSGDGDADLMETSLGDPRPKEFSFYAKHADENARGWAVDVEDSADVQVLHVFISDTTCAAAGELYFEGCTGVHPPQGEWLKYRAYNIDLSTGSFNFTVTYASNGTEVLSGFSTLDGTFDDWDNLRLKENAAAQSFAFDHIEYKGTQKISGFVVDSSGNVISDADVSINISGSSNVTTGFDGAYSFASIGANSDYTITATPEDTNTYSANSTTFSIAESSLANANVTLQASSETVSGTVTDQDGNPIPNATVHVVAVDHNQVTPASGQSKAQRAEKLLEDASDPIPSDWNPDLQLFGRTGFFTTSDGKYVAVHQDAGVEQAPWLDQAELDRPLLQVDPDKQVVLSVWNAEVSAISATRALTDPLNEFDSQLPGFATRGTVVIEQLGPAGDRIGDRVELKTNKTAGGGFLDPSSFEYTTTQLPPGFYRVYPKSNPNLDYVIVSGSPQDVSETLDDDLKSEANQLSERAQEIRNNLAQGKFVEATTTTNSSGEYSVEISPPSAATVAVEAYKAGSMTLNTETDDHPMTVARNLIEDGEYSGALYVQRNIPTYSVPNSNADVTLYKLGGLPYQNIPSFLSQWEDFLNQIREEGLGYLTDFLGEHWSNIDKDTLQDIKESLINVIEDHPSLIDRYRDKLEQDRILDILEEIRNENPERYKEIIQDFTGDENATESDVRDYIAVTDDADTIQEFRDLLNSTEQERYNDLLDKLENTSEQIDDLEGTNEELAEEIDALEQTIEDQEQQIELLRSELDSNDENLSALLEQSIENQNALEQQLEELRSSFENTTGITDTANNTTMTFVFNVDEIDRENVAVFVHYQNGTVDTLGNESWFVEDRVGNDAVVVTDPPSDDRYQTIEVMLSDFEGNVGKAAMVLQNRSAVGTTPLGDAPHVQAIDFSTLNPGPSENVSLKLYPDATTAFESLVSVSVVGPGGTAVTPDTDVSTDSSSFTTDGPGVYNVRMTFNDSSGNQFTRTVKVRAGGQDTLPASRVMILEAPTGFTAVTGEGIDNGKVSGPPDKSQLTTAVSFESGEDAPDSVHIYADSFTLPVEYRLGFKMLKGSDINTSTTVRKHVVVFYHVDPIPEDSVIYRDPGDSLQPISEEGTQYGQVRRTSESGVIETYTESDGTNEVTVNEDPGILDRALYEVRLRLPRGITI